MLRSHQCVEIGDVNFQLHIPEGVETEIVKWSYWKKGDGKQFVILLHGANASAQSFCHVVRIVNQKMPNADILIPEFDSSMLSFSNPLLIVRDIVRTIDWMTKSQEFDQIIFIGHSMGALLARKIYICACGETERAPFELELTEFQQARSWARTVKRIVLLAGINRGWQFSHHLSLENTIFQGLGLPIGNLIVMLLGRLPLIFHFRRGAPFVTQLRIQWLFIPPAMKGNILTVQLLGTIDDIVSPEDNIDLVTGSDFIYLDVPHTGHANIKEMDQTEAGKERAEKFKLALLSDREELSAQQDFPEDQALPPSNPDVKHVVFVIHGIRDRGFWTKKIARRIRSLGGSKIYATETSTYGYFPMLPFLLPFQRRNKVEWLMDQYTENLALYPNAEFHYVGHSNGTYLLAKALQEYPCCRFQHVVFAGSVVPTHYNWTNRIAKKQVKKVLNFVATGDWVVAFFPKLFQVLRWQDLGSAGHDGFKGVSCRLNPLEASCSYPADNENSIYQVEYVRGGHGAALKENYWEAIAHFIVSGTVEKTQLDQAKSLLHVQQNILISRFSQVPYLVWGMIFLAVIWLGQSILTLGSAEWQRTILFMSYLWFLWQILSRV